MNNTKKRATRKAKPVITIVIQRLILPKDFSLDAMIKQVKKSSDSSIQIRFECLEIAE